MAVAASGAAAFHHSQSMHDIPPPFHLVIRLESLYDGQAQVWADITVTHVDGPVGLGGDLEHVVPTYDTQGGMLVYSGLLNATTPIHSGDTIHVIVYHPGGQHVREVTVR